MRAARQRLATAKDLHSLESLAAAWLPAEALHELASLPGKRLRWLPLPLVFWACLNMVFHPGASCRESQRSIQAWWKRRQRHWRNPCSSAFCAARARRPLDWLRRLWWRAADREDALEEMLILCAADLLPRRPGRSGPQVLKRRPKAYQYLTRPRRLMRVSASRNHKGKPRKATQTSSLN
jgi:hypothetical protein